MAFAGPRVERLACGLVRQVDVSFVDSRRSYTKYFDRCAWSDVAGGPSPVVAAIARYSGTTWSILASPNIPNNSLNAVTANSANDIWAVGSEETIQNHEITSTKSLVEHFDGASWSAVTSASSVELTGVTTLSNGTAAAVSDGGIEMN